MNDFIAVDIAILPPDNVMDRAIAINKQYETNFRLNKHDRFPHITLMQAIVKKTDLKKVESILGGIAESFSPLKLNADLSNARVLVFEVRANPQLIKLHTAVMDKLHDMVTYDSRPEYYFDEQVRERSLAWVRNFLTNAAYEKYEPHISLSVSESPRWQETIDFTADRLALCHLGNYNTCRKILFETQLGKQ